MIALPTGVQVYLAAGATDMRKGFDGLAALVQMQLSEDPFCANYARHRQMGADDLQRRPKPPAAPRRPELKEFWARMILVRIYLRGSGFRRLFRRMPAAWIRSSL
jgi:hypothetical protein